MLPSTMCSDVITDKHWLKESLLSNAIKYSNERQHVTFLSFMAIVFLMNLACTSWSFYIRSTGECSVKSYEV